MPQQPQDAIKRYKRGRQIVVFSGSPKTVIEENGAQNRILAS